MLSFMGTHCKRSCECRDPNRENPCRPRTKGYHSRPDRGCVTHDLTQKVSCKHCLRTLADEPKKWARREEEKGEEEGKRRKGEWKGRGKKARREGKERAGRVPGQAFRSSSQWQTCCPLTDSQETTLKAEAKRKLDHMEGVLKAGMISPPLLQAQSHRSGLSCEKKTPRSNSMQLEFGFEFAQKCSILNVLCGYKCSPRCKLLGNYGVSAGTLKGTKVGGAMRSRVRQESGNVCFLCPELINSYPYRFFKCSHC